jgi:hypothetical protein
MMKSHPLFLWYLPGPRHLPRLANITNEELDKYPRIVLLLVLFMLPSTVPADVGRMAGPLSCGSYDEMVKPFSRAELDTQQLAQEGYIMETTTKKKTDRRVKELVH